MKPDSLNITSVKSNIRNFAISEENRIGKIKELLATEYEKGDSPWVIGYSGGKDSTFLTQLVIEVIIKKASFSSFKLKKRKLFVLSSDTLVENPIVEDRVKTNINKINKLAKDKELPVEAIIVKPKIDQTFWVNIIGKGYPVPNQTFRWCTDRLKIAPMNNFMHERFREFQEVIYLIGVRLGESLSRDRVLQNYHNQANRFYSKHPTYKNGKVFKPILDVTEKELWNYMIKAGNTPWNTSNLELYELYRESSDECPLALDNLSQKRSACGQSRWGCWTCTVASEDKSMNNFIKNGYEQFSILKKFRKKMLDEREILSNRFFGSHRLISKTGKVILVNHRTMKLKTRVTKNNETYIVLNKKGLREKTEWKVVNNETAIITNKNPRSKFKIITPEEFFALIANKEIKMWQNRRANGRHSPLEWKYLIKFAENDYRIPGIGPYSLAYRKSLFMQLKQIEKTYQKNINNPNQKIISDDEEQKIKEIWEKVELKIREYERS